jgi:predicted SprT family Zn-dependent metalloprotease
MRRRGNHKYVMSEVLSAWKLMTPIRRALRKHSDQTYTDKTIEYLFSYKLIVNRRFKTCAGLTRYSQRVIDLHPELLETGREKERDETMLHEVAHVIAYYLFREHGHGDEWRQIMESMGHPAIERCHHYEFLEGRDRRYIYECKDCGTRIHRTRKFHKPGKLHLWYHPPCKTKGNGGKYSFIDRHALGRSLKPAKDRPALTKRSLGF